MTTNETVVKIALYSISLIAPLVAIVVGWQNFNKRKIEEAKENSAGVTALQELRDEHKRLEEYLLNRIKVLEDDKIAFIKDTFKMIYGNKPT